MPPASPSGRSATIRKRRSRARNARRRKKKQPRPQARRPPLALRPQRPSLRKSPPPSPPKRRLRAELLPSPPVGEGRSRSRSGRDRVRGKFHAKRKARDFPLTRLAARGGSASSPTGGEGEEGAR